MAEIAFLSKFGSALAPKETDYSCWPLLAASCHGKTDGLVSGAVCWGLIAVMLETGKNNPQTWCTYLCAYMTCPTPCFASYAKLARDYLFIPLCLQR